MYSTNYMMGSMAGSRGSGDAMNVLIIVFSLILTIVSLIMIVPKKRRPTLNGFFKFVHDLFNFRFLVIEKIVQFFYIYFTFAVMLTGVFMLFSSFGAGSAFGYVFGTALMIIVFGPVLFRILFELLMMFILLVKNVIEINNKLQDQMPDDGKNKELFDASFAEYQVPSAPVAPPAPAAPEAPAPQAEVRFCSQCGTPYDAATGTCPNCNK